MIEYDLGAGPQLFDPVYIDSISISSIDGLPEGLTYSCNNGLCSYQGGENGCFSINGIPTYSDEFPLTLNLDLVGQYEIFGIMVPIEITEQITLTLIIDNCQNNIVLGCTDEMACNYDESATTDNESCFYINQTCEECDDIDGDGIGDYINNEGCEENNEYLDECSSFENEECSLYSGINILNF